MFALLNCGKSTANVMFRINPESFKGDNDNKVRYVVGWFFPRHTERRISIKQEDIAQIMDYLQHAYNTTNGLMQTKDASMKNMEN